MEKQKTRSVKEMVEASKKRNGKPVELINEPNMELMAKAALNYYLENK